MKLRILILVSFCWLVVTQAEAGVVRHGAKGGVKVAKVTKKGSVSLAKALAQIGIHAGVVALKVLF